MYRVKRYFLRLLRPNWGAGKMMLGGVEVTKNRNEIK